MKRNSPIIDFLFYTFVFLGSFCLLYILNNLYFLDEYEPKELSIGVELKVGENDIFQMFYRDSISKFSEKLSQKIRVEGSEEYQWIKFSIPDSIALSQIRFDFGNRHKLTPVVIRKFLLVYNGNTKDLGKDSLSTYFKVNQYTVQESKNTFSRKVIGKRSDPFLLSVNLNPIVHQLKQRENYGRVVLNIALSLLLATSILIAVRQRETTRDIVLEGKPIFVCTFLLLTILPFMDNLFSLDKTKIQEKRELAPKPEFSIENINTYPAAFENYFNDHFGFRNKLISYGGILKTKLFKTSPNEEKVIMGKDGWLFYWKPDARSSYKNENSYTREGLVRFTKMITSTDQWATDNDKLFLSIIYPNKHSVYEENLPYRIRNLKRDTIDRTDVAIKIFEGNGILHTRLLENLLNHKKKHQLYFKHDTHWNTYGAYLAYEALINDLRLKDNEILPPLRLNDFSKKIIDDFGHGDLLDLMGVDNSGKWFTEKAPWLSPKLKYDLVRKNGYFGKRTVYIHNKTIKSDKVVLLVGDSFNIELMKFLPYNFKETYFKRSILLDQKTIQQINADIIIYGIVERNLENF